jgi:hypothetical protein
MIGVIDNLIFPLLEARIMSITDQMCGKLRGGETNLLAEAAQITALKDLQDWLKNRAKAGNKINERINQEDRE